MRSAELVGVAQTIACCGEIGGIARWREIAQSRMRAPLVVIVDPVELSRSAMLRRRRNSSRRAGAAQRPLKLSQKPFCIGFPGAVERQMTLLSCAQANTAFEVNSVPLSETIMPGLPRRSISAVSSRATRRPEIEVLRDRRQAFARHVVDDVQDAELSAAGELVMDEIQRPAGVGGRLDDDWRPRSHCAPPRPPLRAPSGPLRGRAGRCG